MIFWLLIAEVMPGWSAYVNTPAEGQRQSPLHWGDDILTIWVEQYAAVITSSRFRHAINKNKAIGAYW